MLFLDACNTEINYVLSTICYYETHKTTIQIVIALICADKLWLLKLKFALKIDQHIFLNEWMYTYVFKQCYYIKYLLIKPFWLLHESKCVSVQFLSAECVFFCTYAFYIVNKLAVVRRIKILFCDMICCLSMIKCIC